MTVNGNGVVVTCGADAAPEIFVTLPEAQPVLLAVCVQNVTTGLARLTVMLL